MSFVYDQCRVSRATKQSVFGQRRFVAVHAEDRLGDQKVLSVVLFAFNQARQLLNMSMWEDDRSRARETQAVDQTGVIQLIRKDHVVGRGKGRKHPHVCEIATAEE